MEHYLQNSITTADDDNVLAMLFNKVIILLKEIQTTDSIETYANHYSRVIEIISYISSNLNSQHPGAEYIANLMAISLKEVVEGHSENDKTKYDVVINRFLKMKEGLERIKKV